MATFNNEDLIKWNDLSTSLQDIIMRKITWNMLHPDLQSWLLDKERRIIELERWRRTKADPMLDDHERRIGSCESQISSLWSKLSDVEDDIDDISKPPSPGDPTQDWSNEKGWMKFPNGLIMQWGKIRYHSGSSNTYIFHKFTIPFPNKAMVIAGSPVTDGRPPNHMNELNWHLTIIDKYSFATHHDEAPCGFTWIAFGY